MSHSHFPRQERAAGRFAPARAVLGAAAAPEEPPPGPPPPGQGTKPAAALVGSAHWHPDPSSSGRAAAPQPSLGASSRLPSPAEPREGSVDEQESGMGRDGAGRGGAHISRPANVVSRVRTRHPRVGRGGWDCSGRAR